MNIFVTNTNPVACAHDHCDVHLRKMIIESAQLLSTAHTLNGSEVEAYKPTHIHHPCTKWASASSDNYKWLFALFENLCAEYTYRFGKIHATTRLLKPLMNPPSHFSDDFVAYRYGFVQAMPDEFKQPSTLHSYRSYLNHKFETWQERDRPIKVEWTNKSKPNWVKFSLSTEMVCV